MIYIAWWTGRGFYTIPIVVASAIAVAAIRGAIGLPDGLWVIGIGLLVSSAVNWAIGSRLNGKSIKRIRSNRLKDRLLYRAPNKFMSVPMESFSVILGVVGLAISIFAVVAPLVGQDKCLDSGGAWHNGSCFH